MMKAARISRRSAISGAIATLAMPAVIASRRADAQAAEKITVRLDFTPWGIHAPFHLAAAKGWFAKFGLEPVLEDGNGSVATVQLAGNGQYDVGHASQGPMAIARGKGMPVRSFVTLFGQNDIALMIARSVGVKQIADLKGKTIAYTPGSLEAPFLDRFLAAGGLTRDSLNLQSVDASAKVGVYVAGRVDGIFSSPTFTLAQFQDQLPTDVFRFADYGLDFLGYGLLATETTIAERPEALGKFASIIAGAWNYVFGGHEDEAVETIIAARPQARLKPAVLRGQIEELRKYFFFAGSTETPALAVTEANWASMLKVLAEAKLMPAGEAASAYFTSDLIRKDIIEAIGSGEGDRAGK
jgi:NitT/TauT family transport system substrate-binding protein